MNRILGIGDNVVDCFLDRRIMYPGGQAMNIAVYSHMLGADSSYMGIFGSDEKAALNRSVLEHFGIEHGFCRYLEGDNAFAYVKTVDNERVFLWSNKGGVAKGKIWHFTDEAECRYISSFDYVFSDQNSNIEEALPEIRKIGPRIIFDFSRKFETDYLRLCAPYCYIAFLSTETLPEDKVISKLREAAEYGAEIAVATRGVNGSIALYQGKLHYQCSIPVEVKDTMGAGDSFESGFIVSLMKHKKITGNEIQEALHSGAVMASRICAMEGSFGMGRNFILTEEQEGFLMEER